MDEQAKTEPMWTAYDVAQQFDWSIDSARKAIRRWRVAGLLEPMGRDSMAFAIAFRPADVRAAREADLRT